MVFFENLCRCLFLTSQSFCNTIYVRKKNAQHNNKYALFSTSARHLETAHCCCFLIECY